MDIEDEMVFRATGRKLMIAGLIIDVICFLYACIGAAFVMNMIRLNAYQPEMMSISDWSPYWRVYSPVLIVFLPTFLYFLVFYRSGILLIIYYFLALPITGWAIFCWIALIVDWTQCGTTFWCQCIETWTVTLGVVTWVNCIDGTGVSGIFLAHFFLLLALWLMSLMLMLLALYIHFSYYWRNQAYDAMNINRTLHAGNFAGYITSDLNGTPLSHAGTATAAVPSNSVRLDKVYSAAIGTKIE